jgi:hypothetical protein
MLVLHVLIQRSQGAKRTLADQAFRERQRRARVRFLDCLLFCGTPLFQNGARLCVAFHVARVVEPHAARRAPVREVFRVRPFFFLVSCAATGTVAVVTHPEYRKENQKKTALTLCQQRKCDCKRTTFEETFDHALTGEKKKDSYIH